MDCFHPTALPVTISLLIIWPVVTLVYYGLTFRWAARLRDAFNPNTNILIVSVLTRSNSLTTLMPGTD